MAAIDKIYLNSYGDYKAFKEWCFAQPKLVDKYGKHIDISGYLFRLWDKPEDWADGKSHPVLHAPSYVDAYIIRNCPIEAVQRELMINYGHKTQECIDEMYHIVTNRTEENKQLYSWLTPEDFIVVDRVVTMPNVDKSDYEKILDGEMIVKPSREGEYVPGKHFKIIKIPYYNMKCNYPIRVNGKTPMWSISVDLPSGFSEYLWWHWHNGSPIGTWDFSSEFVCPDDGWSSSHAHCKSLASLKRRILKWKLPVGTTVKLSGRYVGEDYEIVVKR